LAGGKKAPAEPSESAPRPTPVSRKGSDRGIGGTGWLDRGIGGTGFIGSITKIGSIFVNDAEIFYDSNVHVVIDGHKKSAADLKIGFVARVVTTIKDGKLNADRIASDHEVVGPIAALTADQATVLGQTVDIGTIEGRNTLKVGDWIAVSGLRRPNGAIVATLVETIAPATAQIIGQINRTPEGMARIGSMMLLGKVSDRFLNKRVIARGQADANRLKVNQIVAADLVTKGDRLRRVSIEGYFESVDQSIRLPADPDVRLTASNTNELAAAVENGPAIVEGNIEPDGTIAVTHIRIPSSRFESPSGVENAPSGLPANPTSAGGQQGGQLNPTRTQEGEDDRNETTSGSPERSGTGREGSGRSSIQPNGGTSGSRSSGGKDD
jgi:hypothetical protein